jgi:protein-tyrosine phosphatase
MEQYNIRNLRYTLGEELLAEDMSLPQPKIMRLLNRDVADPWYTRDFEATYKDLVEGCTRLINECK